MVMEAILRGTDGTLSREVMFSVSVLTSCYDVYFTFTIFLTSVNIDLNAIDWCVFILSIFISTDPQLNIISSRLRESSAEPRWRRRCTGATTTCTSVWGNPSSILSSTKEIATNCWKKCINQISCKCPDVLPWRSMCEANTIDIRSF